MSATVSWTILRFTQQEQYYVEYGTERTNLNMTTDLIQSPMDTSLLNQSYSTDLLGLSPGTVYYVRVVAVYEVIFARSSDIVFLRTYEPGTQLLTNVSSIVANSVSLYILRTI